MEKENSLRTKAQTVFCLSFLLSVNDDAFFGDLSLLKLFKGFQRIVEIEIIGYVILQIDRPIMDPAYDLIVGFAFLDLGWELLELEPPVVRRLFPVDVHACYRRYPVAAHLSLIVDEFHGQVDERCKAYGIKHESHSAGAYAPYVSYRVVVAVEYIVSPVLFLRP